MTSTFGSPRVNTMASTTTATMTDEGPVAIVCVGMAGSGKTTFMQRLNAYLHGRKCPPYIMNLDPAVRTIPFEPNIDIRDSIDYKEVMKQYNLGPNGGILTSLNLFTTKVDQILGLLEKRTAPDPEKSNARRIKNIIVDTPGQIEVFVWSASGSILLDSLASSFPTVLAYVIDTPRTSSTSTFMSNMLYACSILYKTKLPMILVFNKTDVKDAEFAKHWMTDFQTFQEALTAEENNGTFGGDGSGGSGYMSSLLNSMSLMLEEFYAHLNVVGVSSMTGAGMDEFFQAVREKKDEFERDYKPELERRRKDRDTEKEKESRRDLGLLMSDLNVDNASGSTKREEEAEALNAIEDTIEDIPATMVDPDDDESEDEDKEGLDKGLTLRYQQALGKQGQLSEEDQSFLRYMQANR